MENINNVEKICSFCVSDWHFITILIPYINQKANENNIEIFVEENFTQKINTFLTKVNINLETKQLIKSLRWSKSKIREVADGLNNINSKKSIIIVKGSNSYIDAVNQYVEKNLSKEGVTIVNFYEVMQFNNNINGILEKHEKVLNASGEKDIKDVFEGYEKEEKAL